ncbi:MAG: hypothetical protein R2726_18240 [Acidimicrobiales bacterium]
MRVPGTPRAAALAGVVVGGAVVVALVATGVLRLPPRPEGDARDQFVAAYERSRHGTYVVESQFERRMDTGAVLTSAQRLAQRPPDRVVRQFGGIDGVLQGRAVVCSTGPDGSFGCRRGDAPRDFDAEVRQEVDNVRGYVTPPAPIYRVAKEADGCFALTQVIVYASPPFGSSARFCFDDATGAPTTVERRLDNATERLEATEVRTTVTDDDLSLEARDEYGAHTSEATSSTGTEAPAPPSVTAAPPGTEPPSPTTTAPAGSVPAPSSPPPTVAGGAPALGELALLTNASLLERGAAAADPRPYVDEALRRIRAFTLSVNDPHWRDPRGTPIPLWEPVATALLADGTARW